jgi:hypothetical protein
VAKLNFFEMLVEALWFPGVWLWGIGLIGLLTWLLLKREAMLTSPTIWKPMTFTSLAVGFGLTLFYGATVAIIYLPGAGCREAFIFYFMTGVLLPLVFTGCTGIGLAYSVIRFRARLETKGRSLALVISGALIAGSVALMFAAVDVPDPNFLFGN